MAKEKRKWFEMKASADKTAEIFIYGSIGKSWFDDDAVSAKSFVDDLKALGDVDKITLRINSPGGVVYDGLAIHNAIKAHKAEVTAVVDGLAASMASFIAMAANKIVMPKNSFMLIHKASGMCWGNSDDVEKLMKDLKRIDKVAAQAYADRSKQALSAVNDLMAEDRLMDADEAVELGYADEIGEEVEIAANYDHRGFNFMPAGAREKFEHLLSSEDPPSEDDDDEEEDDDDGDKPAASPSSGNKKADKKGSVVSLDAARGEGSKRGREYSAEITDLCALAGAPASMASDFIRNGVPVASARKKLLAYRAEGSVDVNGHHSGSTGLLSQRSQVQDKAASWDKAIASINARAPAGAR